MKKCGLIICMATLGFLCSKTALKAAAAEATPWQTYLDKAPVQAEQFAADPLGTLVRLFAAEPVQLLRDTMQQYADVLLFLSLAAGLAFLLQDTADRALLELAAAGGCGVLLWQELDKLAAALCTRMAGWKSYLLGFLPVYSGVLAAGGEWNAGAAANGFLLTVLCFIAQAVTLWLQPLLRSYLAISMACGISSRKSLFEGCTLTGRLLRQAIGWAGKAFAALMSIQRVVTVQLDRSASRLGQLLTGSVPIVGQALSNAADAVLAGMQLLKSTLGIAALLSIGAELVSFFAGQSWAGRCIKAAAGLYILAVLLAQLPRLPGKVLTAFSGSTAPAVLSAMQSDTLETDILTETETRLAEYCTAQCRQQFGLDASVTVTLEKAGQQVVVKKVVAAFPAGCTAAQKQAALSFLQQTLGTAPTAAEGSTP
ncbi:hypothetical protein DW844_03725 [Faecalibacterium prausnitzii]|uniref:stage III sporulation protein AE n=2 Tax=Oscillospiraceae TaxID=216572 RepID=UPI000E5352C4|nr:hypothetical protein [Faecalibacterium prausnitzii]RHC43307.1 hypothetical protein DW844_03725 [Faecalibacterium prausnitzii]